MYRTLVIAAVATLIVLPAAAQTWQPSGNSEYENQNWRGQSYQVPGSSYTETDLRNQDGDRLHCTTFRLPGTSAGTTTCR